MGWLASKKTNKKEYPYKLPIMHKCINKQIGVVKNTVPEHNLTQLQLFPINTILMTEKLLKNYCFLSCTCT